MTCRVKICGITNLSDACSALDAGADYIGVIWDIAASPRTVSAKRAATICRKAPGPVIVLTDKSAAEARAQLERIAPAGIQLIGDPRPERIAALRTSLDIPVWQTLRIRPQGREGLPPHYPDLLARCAEAGACLFVIDTLVPGQAGGTGRTCDWDLAARIVSAAPLPVMLAGGICPANAAEAIVRVRPAGIDLSSGVERVPGRKDPQKIDALMQAVRAV